MARLKLGVFVPQGWRMDLADVADPIEKFETMSRCAREAEKAARRTGQDEGFVRSWHPWSGDAEHIAQVIGSYVEAGIDYVIVNVPNAFEGGVITRFAEEVFPRLGLRAEE